MEHLGFAYFFDMACQLTITVSGPPLRRAGTKARVRWPSAEMSQGEANMAAGSIADIKGAGAPNPSA
jgi:hypothetical protein